MKRPICLVICGLLLTSQPVRADWKSRAATEAAEAVMARWGAKVARNVPALAERIEGLAARYGEEAIVAVRKAGPAAFGLVEAAGANGGKAVRVLALYGEEGATHVLSRPAAMRQFMTYGEQAAGVLVKHPGIAETVIERGGAQGIKALESLSPREGRRLAMLLEGDLAKAAQNAEVLKAVGNQGGGRVVNFLWENKGVLAGGAALAVFLANPEPFLNGARDITKAVGDHVVAPVAGGVFTAIYLVIGGIIVMILCCAVLIFKHGYPNTIKSAPSR